MPREVELQIIPTTNGSVKNYTVRQIIQQDDGSETAVVIMDTQTDLSAVLSFLSTRITPQLLNGGQVTVQLG